MTRKQDIETIRKACIEANPSIMELGFGCIILIGNKYRTIFKVMPEHVYIDKSLYGSWTVPRESGFETIGRNITLSDCLLALRIDEIDSPEMLDALNIETICLMWNKHEDRLESQSDDTLSALARLLG